MGGSGPVWVTTPLPYASFSHYTVPVYRRKEDTTMKLTRPNLQTTRLAAVVFCRLIVLLAATAKAAPPINITTCTTITAPGNYIVTAPISCPSSDAILIKASQVTLKLKDFNVTGNPSAVHALSVSQVVILGPGSVTNSGSSGILFEGVQRSQVIGVNANHNPRG